MPKFKIMVEDLNVYGCTIEAKNRDEAEMKWEEAFDNMTSYYEAIQKFSEPREYDGYVEVMVYGEDEDEDDEGKDYLDKHLEMEEGMNDE